MNKIDSLTGVPQLLRLCSFSLDLYDIKEESIWIKALWGKGGGGSKCAKLKTHFCLVCVYAVLLLTIILSIKHYLQYTACFFNHYITFTFNHLADAFIQSDIQMRRTIEAIRFIFLWIWLLLIENNHIFRGGQPSARGGLVPPDPPGISTHD